MGLDEVGPFAVAWVNNWAHADRNDPEWWQGVMAKGPGYIRDVAAVQRWLGNKQAGNEHECGLPVLKLIELRQKEYHATGGRYATSIATMAILSDTWLSEKRMHTGMLPFCVTKRGNALNGIMDEENKRGNALNGIMDEEKAKGHRLYVQLCRLECDIGQLLLESPSVELGEPARSGNDSSAGVEEPSTLVQRRCAPRTSPQE